jgi:hypothetical protein
MSYAVNSIVGNISGIVSYSNGSNSSFNAELNYDGQTTLNFLANATESRDTMGRIVNTTSEGSTVFRDGFTFLNSVTSTLFASLNWSAHASAAADDGRVINGVVYHMNYNIAFDDGTTYPVSATYEKVGGAYVRTNHTSATNHFSGASNKAAIVAKIADSFKQMITVSSSS